MQLFKKLFLGHAAALFVMTALIVSQETPVIAQWHDDFSVTDASRMHEIIALCESVKHATVAEIKTPLRPNPKTEVSRQVNQFRAALRKMFKREQVALWEERLMIDPLRETLRQAETDLELVDAILLILNGDEPELKRPSFAVFKKSLEKNRPLFRRQNRQSHTGEVESVFDSLPGRIASYLETPDATHAEAVSEALEYLSEMRQAEELVAMIRQMVMRPNLKVRVRSDVIAPVFLREIDEPVPVNDMILGTWVRGSGHLAGKTSVALVPSREAAVFHVTLQGMLNTTTVGTNGPVRVHTNNTATVTTTKEIQITKNSLALKPASTNVRQSSHITHVDYSRPGPLVRMIAPGQIQDRKPASDAESERLMRGRFNTRMDEAVKESLAWLRDALTQTAADRARNNVLQWNLERVETTQDALLLEAVVEGKGRLTTMSQAPDITSNAGLFVQLHESLANNAGACELSGKTLIEEQVMTELKKLFPRLSEHREDDNDGNEPMLTVSFSERPINVCFADNVIRAVVETTAIERGGNTYPGMEIELQFRIESIDGGFQFVAAEPPEALPLGFDREEDQLSMSEITIRAIMMKKLARLTGEPIEWKESVIEGKNGTMTFKPVYLSAENGWLSVGLNVIEYNR